MAALQRADLGLITLHRHIVDSVKGNSEIRICPAQYLMYLKIQYKRWEGVDVPEMKENFRRSNLLKVYYDTFESLSEVFMSAVLNASRCQYSQEPCLY